jgi:hypothetical protein
MLTKLALEVAWLLQSSEPSLDIILYVLFDNDNHVSVLIVKGGARGKGTWGKLGDEMELHGFNPEIKTINQTGRRLLSLDLKLEGTRLSR